MHKPRKTDEPQPPQAPQPALPCGRPIRTLAASLQMVDETPLNVALDLAVGAHGVPQGKIVRPSLQMPIHLSNQCRDRLETLMTIRHLMQLLPLPLDRLLRRKHIQIFPLAPFPVAIVPKCVSRKVQTCPFFPQVHHSRLFPVDLQLELSFQSVTRISLADSGIFIQAVFSSSYATRFQQGHLAPRALPRFFATSGLSDSLPGAAPVMSSRRALVACAPTLRGLPGSSTDLSPRAVPNHPGRSAGCLCLLLHQRLLASSQSADWPPSYSYRGRIGFTCVTAHGFASRHASPVTGAHARSATR